MMTNRMPDRPMDVAVGAKTIKKNVDTIIQSVSRGWMESQMNFFLRIDMPETIRMWKGQKAILEHLRKDN